LGEIGLLKYKWISLSPLSLSLSLSHIVPTHNRPIVPNIQLSQVTVTSLEL